MTADRVFLEVGMPVMPELAGGSLKRWHEVHQAASSALGALGGPTSEALRDWRLGRCLEGLAGLTPSISGATESPLFPAPRRFLSPHDLQRMAGCEAAVEHIDVRHRLIEDGNENNLLRPETPYVLHALVEGRPTGSDITNPGMLRVADTGWPIRKHVYQPPPTEMVRSLLDLLVETVEERPASPPALGAWALFTFLSIHPFVDGNGRTARLLYLALSSLAIPALDLGALEGIALHRQDYLDALEQGQWNTPHWDPRKLDAAPFVSAMFGWSVAGAERQIEQASAVEGVCDELRIRFAGIDETALGLVVRAWLDRGVRVGVGEWSSVRNLELLTDVGILRREPLPPSAVDTQRSTVVYSLSDATNVAIEETNARRSISDGRL